MFHQLPKGKLCMTGVHTSLLPFELLSHTAQEVSRTYYWWRTALLTSLFWTNWRHGCYGCWEEMVWWEPCWASWEFWVTEGQLKPSVFLVMWKLLLFCGGSRNEGRALCFFGGFAIILCIVCISVVSQIILEESLLTFRSRDWECLFPDWADDAL